MMSRSILWRVIVAGLSIVSFSACGERIERPVSFAPVHYELSVQDPRFRALLSPGGIVLIPEAELSSMRTGEMGLAVVRSLTEARYYAFDLMCPVESGLSSRLELIGLQLSCPRCGSRFDLLSGTGVPVEGEAKLPLLRYRVAETTRGTILITN